jgi:uncharacterized protein with von Willebrand factor type A (vWA) domain
MPQVESLSGYLGLSSEMQRRIYGHHGCIKQDALDRSIYADLLEESNELRDLNARSSRPWPTLLNDLWAAYYKTNPELLPEDQISTAFQMNREFVKRILEDPTTEQTRVATALDELAAGVATVAAGQTLIREIEDRESLQKAMRQAQAAQEQEQLARRYEEQNDTAAAETCKQNAQEYAEKTKELLRGAAQDLRRAVRVAMQAGEKKAGEVQEVLGGWGVEPGELATMPLGERLQLARKLTTWQMKKIADLIGRFRNLARARQKQKVKRTRDEIHSITLGSDLGHVLPQELALLRHPVFKKDFRRRFVEGGLMQYELETNEPKGRGPIIALIDVSGSMSGERLEWAIATALALVDTAARQQRRAVVVFFNTQIVKEVHFEPHEHSMEKFLEVATMGTSGGTSYEPALMRGLELIQQAGFREGDLMLLTDGECGVTEERKQLFLSERRRLGFRLWGILTGHDCDMYGTLTQLATRFWPVTQLTEDLAGDIFEEVY